MEIIVGEKAGFCYGVKNAVDKSEEMLKKEKLCCLGEIVHNKQVVQKLENSGMNFIDNLEENYEKRKTVIRAHGVGKETYNLAKEMNIELIDLTCPMVLKIHKIVEEHSKGGYFIFVIGTKNHPETKGTVGFCNKNYSVIEDELDIEESIKLFKKSQIKKLVVVVQTTYSLEKFKHISEIISEKINDVELKILNTICDSTKTRQEETNEIAKKVEYMIIIGGKNSSNTRKLYEIAKKNCENTVCIETYKELDISKIKTKNIVGIMAGASTPQESIQEVVKLLKNA